MNRTMTEEKVLRKLDISDFRHMTKEKVVDFVSMIPQMDPEVAKLALEQFPSFAETGRELIGCIKDSMNTIVSSNAENMAEFNARCKEILDTLEEELKREDLSDEGRQAIIDGIMQLMSLMSQKDAENKEFHHKIFRDVIKGSFVVLMIVGVPLGFHISNKMDI